MSHISGIRRYAICLERKGIKADKNPSKSQKLTGETDIIRRPKATPIHQLERSMRCRDCSQLQGRPYKRSHLVALRATKISADDPPSTWWPGER
jgi:hypothetical protein